MLIGRATAGPTAGHALRLPLDEIARPPACDGQPEREAEQGDLVPAVRNSNQINRHS
jgi:hypothetical protein